MDIAQIIDDLGVWTWWIVAALFLVLELLAPGVFFLWLAAAAAIVAANMLFFDLSWQMQIGSFAVLSLASLIVSRRYFQRSDVETDRPFLNRRTASLVGKELTVAEALTGGEGRVRVGDTLWLARGPDAPEGARVKVTGVDDNVLQVEPV